LADERAVAPRPDPGSHVPNVPGNIISVGALVLRDNAILVVRLTYGPTAGTYSLPGGWLDVGEDIETGVDARCLGVIGLRVRADVERSQTDLVWLLEYVSGEPSPQAGEADDARFMPIDEIATRDDVEQIVRELAERHRTGEREAWKLFV
jgi:ADP-ribose pyrophosphatase YjhB (NUDIX family)